MCEKIGDANRACVVGGETGLRLGLLLWASKGKGPKGLDVGLGGDRWFVKWVGIGPKFGPSKKQIK